MDKENIKSFRKSKSLTQLQFAEYLGLNRRTTIGEWETGKKPIPKWVELRIESELKK